MTAWRLMLAYGNDALFGSKEPSPLNDTCLVQFMHLKRV
jgi:hypothetical protein